MTRIHSTKLVMLVVFLLLQAVVTATNRWVSSNYTTNDNKPQINFSGSTQSTGIIEVTLPGFIMQENIVDGQTISLPRLSSGHPMLERGNPDIQKINFSLELSAQGNLNITLVDSEYTDYSNINIPPSVGNIDRTENYFAPVKSDTYSIDAFYPGKLFDQAFPHIIRNTRAQSIYLYPFQYNAVTKTLRVYTKLVLQLENGSEAGDNTLSIADMRLASMEEFMPTFINSSYNSLKAGKLPNERGRMIIISPTQFIEAVQPLANWRNQTGIKTEIVDASIFSNPDQIYSFIKDKYYSYGDLSYLLLVGDAEQVPTYMLPYGASDNYYSFLSGNDHYPDILVGRFSAETVEDVEIQVKRTLEYEKTPSNGESWIPNATGIASSLSCGDDLESDAQHIRNLLTELKKGTYTSVNEFYEGSHGESDADGNPTTDMVVTKLKTGTGVIFYSGHGSPNSWATGGISKSVVDYLDNFSKYPLIWSVACETGNFKGQRCLAEAWLRAGTSSKPSGAVAALMASGTQTTFPPMEAQDKIAEILGSNSSGILTMGGVSVAGLISMNDAYGSIGYPMTDMWVLFGDPALNIRTDKPKTLSATLMDNIGEGRLYYKVSSNANDGLVCLSQENKVMGIGNLERGNSNIVLDYPAAGSSYEVTVTSMNYIPFQKTISVSNLPGIPACVSPFDNSKLQPISNSLCWNTNDGASSDYYLVNVGTNNPPTNLLTNVKTTNSTFNLPVILEYATTYYWQIVSVNKNGITVGPINQFTTVFKPDEDFEPELKHKQLWANGGSKEWILDSLQYFDGKKALRSGNISDNQFSSISFPCEVRGCEFVSFWSKTSTEINDKLQFYIDNELMGEWSGENDWQYHVFTIQAGNRNLEWRYQKNNEGKSTLDAVWLDDIHLPVHDPMYANAQVTAQSCEKAIFNTEATADNYFNIIWTSEGDGVFNNNGLCNSTYTPGLRDIMEGSTNLTMQVNGSNGCESILRTTHLEINPSPKINLPSDTIVSANQIELNAEVNTSNSYSWQPLNSNMPIINVDSSMAVNGIAILQLQVISEKGCISEKEIRVHFTNNSVQNEYSISPNPSNGNFTLTPQKGSSVVDKMLLYDSNGKCVWQQNHQQSIFESSDVSIKDLEPGVYQFITHSNSGVTWNKVIIN